MEKDTGLVTVRAERRLPGRAPKCAVCRKVVQKGARCIWIKGQKAPNSKFYMHARCAASVLFRFMQTFNYVNNGMKQPEPGTVKEYPKIVEG
jgi:hypothetical protein